jgi:hypothetical protein
MTDFNEETRSVKKFKAVVESPLKLKTKLTYVMITKSLGSLNATS